MPQPDLLACGPDLVAVADQKLVAVHTAMSEGRVPDAIATLLAVPPAARTPQMWTVLGAGYSRTGQTELAMAAYRTASLLVPDDPDALTNATFGLREHDRESESIAILRCALRLNAELPEAWHNLGAAFRNLGRHDLALACFTRASELWDAPMTDVGLSEVYAAMGDAPAAIQAAERVIARTTPDDSDNLDARFALGLAELSAGNLAAGWSGYAARLERANYVAITPHGLPTWNRDRGPNEHVLVWREQGIGDEVRFLSCLHDLLPDVSECVVLCSPRLAPIVRRSFPVRVITQAHEIPQDVTSHIALGSLLATYRTDIAEFRTTPWLVPDPDLVAHWRTALETLGPGPMVGLSWRSMLLTNRRNLNYPELEDLAPLATLRTVQFIDLQYDHHAEEVARLATELGVRIHHFDDLDLRNDIDGVLALCAALDAVVTVGNAVSEFAGSVGTPTFELGLRHAPFSLGRQRSCWHPATTYVTRNWDEPWSVAVDGVVSALLQRNFHSPQEQV